MRQIVLDTETTGLSPETGHRVIEIGCVELIDRTLTGKHFHYYLNPQRKVDEGAFRVHGISNEFLEDKPLFKSIAESLIDFIRDSELIIHNAPFDIGFLNAEFSRLNWPKKVHDYCSISCTLKMAREKHPGQKSNLDALCKRYSVNNSNRELHGALLDAEILASVYLAMTGGQTSLFDNILAQDAATLSNIQKPRKQLKSSSPVYKPSLDELSAHQSFVDLLKAKSETTWE